MNLAAGVLVSLAGAVPVVAQAPMVSAYAYGPSSPYAPMSYGYAWSPGRCPAALPNRPVNASRMRARAMRPPANLP